MSEKQPYLTKEAKCLGHLRQGPITSLEIMYSVATTQPERLIFGLRQRGFTILTERVKKREGRGWYARYHLVGEPTTHHYEEQMELFG